MQGKHKLRILRRGFVLSGPGDTQYCDLVVMAVLSRQLSCVASLNDNDSLTKSSSLLGCSRWWDPCVTVIRANVWIALWEQESP